MNDGDWRRNYFGNANEARYLTVNLLIAGAMVILIVMIFTPEFFFPSISEKRQLAHRELLAKSNCIRLYKQDFGDYPYSLDQLKDIEYKSRESDSDCGPSKDPWGRDYQYFRISDKRAVVLSTGRNGRLDTPFDILVSTPTNELFDLGKDRIFKLRTGKDQILVIGQ